MKAPIGKKYSMLAVCTLRAPYLSAAKHRSQQAYLAGLRRHTCRPAREKASQQARLARHADADPHDDASEHDASRHDAHGARPCALFLSAHLASSCSIFTWGSHPSSSGCAHGLCTSGCAWGASRVGLVAILCDFFASPMRQGLAAAWAMLVDVLLLVAAAGSLRASLLVALLHLCLLR